jgi:very-short-patch-repair endonuclease
VIIEVDGSIHWEDGRPEADQSRQRYLENLGYQVIRVNSEDVMKNLEGVAAMLQQVLSK